MSCFFCAICEDLRDLRRNAQTASGKAEDSRQRLLTAGAFASNTPSTMLALAVGVSGWVTISQARFGGQIGAIRGQFRGENDENTPHVQQKL